MKKRGQANAKGCMKKIMHQKVMKLKLESPVEEKNSERWVRLLVATCGRKVSCHDHINRPRRPLRERYVARMRWMRK